MAALVDEALGHHADDMKLGAIHEEVRALCRAFPLYAG